MSLLKPAPLLPPAAVVLLGLLLTFAGWRNAYDATHIDDIGNRDNARAILSDGAIPVTNGLSGLGAYNPAGSSWYLIPSVFFEDIRIGERFVCFLLYVLTIIPLYLLAVRIADRYTALWVILLYTVSAVGIFFEHSIWYRARPFAYAWLALFAVRWFQSGSGKHLFGLVVASGLGLLIHLEMAPIFVGLAVAYWKFRPPVAWRALAVSTAVVLVAWMPFLRFQIDRGFVDLKSSLTVSQIGPDRLETLLSYGRIGTWQEPEQRIGPFTPTPSQARKDRSLIKRALIRGLYFGQMTVSNFRRRHAFGILPLLLVVVFGIVVANHVSDWPRRLAQRRSLTFLGIVVIVLAAVFNEWTIASIVGRVLDPVELRGLRMLEVALVLSGVTILVRHRVLQALTSFTHRIGLGGAARPVPVGLQILALLVVPTWITFALLAHFDRFLLGFWPLQLLLIGGSLIYVSRYWNLDRRIRLVAVILAVVLVVPNTELTSIFATWARDGYGGTAPPLIEAAEAVARLVDEQAIVEPKIGYLFFFGGGYKLVWGMQDERFGGIGSGLAQYLRLQHDVEPTRPPPEGFTAEDDIRIVQVEPASMIEPHRFVVDDLYRYRTVGRYGPYEVVQRASQNDI